MLNINTVRGESYARNLHLFIPMRGESYAGNINLFIPMRGTWNAGKTYAGKAYAGKDPRAFRIDGVRSKVTVSVYQMNFEKTSELGPV